MGLIRPATPGFLVTLVATILLAVVSFCVPYFKSVFFLKANISISGINGSITFGTLGYCLELSNGTTCSSPSVGYQLDINSLVGNKLPIEIPQVVVKWLTYALVLHIVALALSAGSAIFGLLAHIREMSMTCCSTCVSGFAAAVAMLAFVFDLAFFFLAKARINKVGSAEMGNAIWLTLAAWILLFFSGCFYTLGRCCISNRKSRHGGDWDKMKSTESGPVGGGVAAEQLRLDAVKAEADRKARQKDVEIGLPAFHEVQPLAARIDGDNVYVDEPYKDGHATQGGGYTSGGYMQAPAGSRAVDEYYSPSRTNQAASTYPPPPQQDGGYAGSAYAYNAPNATVQQPRRKGSGYAQSQYMPSAYANNAPHTVSPQPENQYLSSIPQQYNSDRYGSPAQEHGHAAGGTSYHTAASHQQYPTNYSHYDPYETQQQAGPAYNTDYNNNSLLSSPPIPAIGYVPNPSTYYSTQSVPQGHSHLERNYTLGGDGYGGNPALPMPEHSTSYLGEMRGSPGPINTNTAFVPPTQTSPVKGPRSQPQLSVRNDDSPPVYEAGTSSVAGAWGKH